MQAFGLKVKPYNFIYIRDNILRKSTNIDSLKEDYDNATFTITRKRTRDTFILLCLDEYTLTLGKLMHAMKNIPNLGMVYLGGGWNACTREAKDYALENKISIVVTGELHGAIQKDDYWNFYKVDEDGNKVEHIRKQ